MIKKIRKWYNGIKMLRFLEEDIPDTTLEHLIKEINKKQLPAKSLISSCYEKILKISTAIRTKNRRAAFESEMILMYIVFTQIRVKQLDAMVKCTESNWYISIKFTHE